MSKPHALEVRYRIYNEADDGACIEVFPSADGFDGVIDLAYRDEKGVLSQTARLSVTFVGARLLAEALLAATKDQSRTVSDISP